MPEAQRVDRVRKRHRAALERDGAAAWRMRAGEDLDQRRFPGAVVADKRDNLSAVNVEVDVGQSGNGAEVLRDASKAQHSRRGPAPISQQVRPCPGFRFRRSSGTSGRREGRRPDAAQPNRSRIGSGDGRVVRASAVHSMPSCLQPSAYRPVQSWAGGLDLLVDDLRLQVLPGDDGRHEQLRGRSCTASSPPSASRLSGARTATSAAAPATISLGLEIVLYWSPAMMS